MGVISIDLAFETSNDPCSHGVVGDELIWNAALISWIDHVRADRAIHCPQVVRDCAEISMGLRFTDDTAIAELNRIWRQRPESTDVLSFPALEDAPEPLEIASVELGDIIVSVETAGRQALEQGHSLNHELRWLVSHGLLHLLGWDHPDQVSLEQMLDLQERLLEISGNVRTRGVDPVQLHSNGDAH